LAAGYVTETEVRPGTAIRIMTGAPVPPGADAVVRFEDTEQGGEWVDILAKVPVGKNVRLAGEDVRKGSLALRRGSLIRPQEVGMLAALGRKQVPVTRRPRVAILATGDEVVEIDVPLAPGKIRNSNSYSNAAQVLRCGGVPVLLGIARDQTEEPFAFGKIRGVPLLGLPGNPVSAMVSFELFARAAIFKMLGLEEWKRPTVEATLMNEVKRKDERRHYWRVRVESQDGEYRAYLTGGQGSGILSSMVQANGLAIIPEDWSHAPAGSRVKVMMLDWK
jgi:molybdopterin molybdotransferase